MGKITIEVYENTFGKMIHPNILLYSSLANYIFAVFELVSYRYLVGNYIFKWHNRGELSN